MDHAPKKYWTRVPAELQTGRSRERTCGHASAKTLRIDVTGADFLLSKALRAMAVRQVLLALSRFGGQVRKVTVRMAQPANPSGGVDQRCRMRAWLQAADDVGAEAINGRIETAVGRAAARLAKRVAWALDGAASDGAHAPRPVLRARRTRPS